MSSANAFARISGCQDANVHGSAIRIGDLGIFVRGPARAGKSSLCLSALRRAPALGLAAGLVADDRVILRRAGDRLWAAPHPRLAGLIEISGVGLIREPNEGEVAIDLLVELHDRETIERLPEQIDETILDIKVRRILLPAREAAYGADVLVTLALRGMPLIDLDI